MNFWHFFEMLEFNLWHFWKIILFLKFLLTVLQQVPKHLVWKTNDLGMVDCLKELVKNNWISQLLEWTRKGINTYNFFGQRGWKILKIMLLMESRENSENNKQQDIRLRAWKWIWKFESPKVKRNPWSFQAKSVSFLYKYTSCNAYVAILLKDKKKTSTHPKSYAKYRVKLNSMPI